MLPDLVKPGRGHARGSTDVDTNIPMMFTVVYVHAYTYSLCSIRRTVSLDAANIALRNLDVKAGDEKDRNTFEKSIGRWCSIGSGSLPLKMPTTPSLMISQCSSRQSIDITNGLNVLDGYVRIQ
jgi:hypothetical protein